MGGVESYLIQYLLLITIIVNLNAIYLEQGHNNLVVNRFVFGSCYNSQNKKRMDIFNNILLKNPDLFVWLGDATYIDRFSFKMVFGIAPDFDFENSILKFDEVYNNEFYKPFRLVTPIIGTWDDHDFQYNNALGNVSDKDKTRKMYLDFLDVPANHQIRTTEKSINWKKLNT